MYELLTRKETVEKLQTKIFSGCYVNGLVFNFRYGTTR